MIARGRGASDRGSNKKLQCWDEKTCRGRPRISPLNRTAGERRHPPAGGVRQEQARCALLQAQARQPIIGANRCIKLRGRSSARTKRCAGRIAMYDRSSIGALVLAAALLTTTPAPAFDDAK